MKFIKDERSWKRWARPINLSQGTPIEPPEHYPCYAYLTVGSYAYEEDCANYLYRTNVFEMYHEMLPYEP